MTVGRDPDLGDILAGQLGLHVVLGCECAWEPEHGLQLVFRDGRRLTRISQFDGDLTGDGEV